MVGTSKPSLLRRPFIGAFYNRASNSASVGESAVLRSSRRLLATLAPPVAESSCLVDKIALMSPPQNDRSVTYSNKNHHWLVGLSGTGTLTARTREIRALGGAHRWYSRNAGEAVAKDKPWKNDHASVTALNSNWDCTRCGTANPAPPDEDYTPELVFICRNCKALRPSSTLNIDLQYASHVYWLFGIENITYDISLEKLRSTHTQLQMLLHPDKLIAETNQSTALTHYSSLISRGYQLLKHPLTRAELLLQHFDPLPIQEAAKSEREPAAPSQPVCSTATTITDESFLTKFFEIEEEIENLTSSDEAAALTHRLLQEYEATICALGAAFQARQFAAAREILRRAQFYFNVHHHAKYWNP